MGVILSLIIKYMIRKNLILDSVLILLLVSAIIISGSIFCMIESVLLYHAKQRAVNGMEFLIILGAQVRGTIITKALKRRLDTAIAYLKDNPQTIAIVSGGRGKDEWISEAEAMEYYLLGQGIQRSRIIKEDKSRSTYENIFFTKELIKTDAAVAIVTNGFHIFRSIRIAKKQGFSKVQGLAAPTDRLLAINYYVREAAGVLKDKFYGNI